MEPEGIVNRVSRFMPQNAHAFTFPSAFHFKHLRTFQLHQPGVRQIKWNRETRDAVGREPFLGKPDVRAKVERSGRQLAIELFEP